MGWEGGPRAPRPEPLRPLGLTSRGALSRHLAASYTGPGRRGAWPALCSEPRVPDSRSQQARTRLGGGGRPGHMPGSCDASPAPAAATSGNLLGALLSPRPGPQPAFHDLLSPAPNAGAAKGDHSRVIPGTWAQAGAHTRGTGGLFAHGTPPPPASHTHSESPASCRRVPRQPARPGQAQGCAPLRRGRRPSVQALLRVPCPSPQETIGARASALHPLFQLPGSCREGPAATGHALTEGVLGRRRAGESDALGMAAWRSSCSCPDPPSNLVTAFQTTRRT